LWQAQRPIVCCLTFSAPVNSNHLASGLVSDNYLCTFTCSCTVVHDQVQGRTSKLYSPSHNHSNLISIVIRLQVIFIITVLLIVINV